AARRADRPGRDLGEERWPSGEPRTGRKENRAGTRTRSTATLLRNGVPVTPGTPCRGVHSRRANLPTGSRTMIPPSTATLLRNGVPVTPGTRWRAVRSRRGSPRTRSRPHTTVPPRWGIGRTNAQNPRTAAVSRPSHPRPGTGRRNPTEDRANPTGDWAGDTAAVGTTRRANLLGHKSKDPPSSRATRTGNGWTRVPPPRRRRDTGSTPPVPRPNRSTTPVKSPRAPAASTSPVSNTRVTRPGTGRRTNPARARAVFRPPVRPRG